MSRKGLIATATAMFAAGSLVTSAQAGGIKCSGANSCKGTSACKSASSSCKGQNSCKGKGFLEMTAKECTDAQKQARAILQGHE